MITATEAAPAVSAPGRTTVSRPINRFEHKYLVPQKLVPDLFQAFRHYTQLDPHSPDERGYRVYSVYWDSPRLAFFWEKIEGVKVRRKLRFRLYGDQPDVFIEIKQRIDRTLQKRRVRWSLDQVLATFGDDGALVEAHEGSTNPVVNEVLLLCHQFNLRPTIAISYRRTPLFGVFEPDLRVTFDTRVQYHRSELSLQTPFESGKYIIDPRIAIMEVKFNHHVPLWLIRIVERFNLTVTRMSKYCSAVDREYFGGQLT